MRESSDPTITIIDTPTPTPKRKLSNTLSDFDTSQEDEPEQDIAKEFQILLLTVGLGKFTDSLFEQVSSKLTEITSNPLTR